MLKVAGVFLGLVLVFALVRGFSTIRETVFTTATPTVAKLLPEGSFGKQEPPQPTPSPTTRPTPVAPFPVIPNGYLEKALARAYAGTTVVVDGHFMDIDAVKFQRSMRPFEETTGITVEYIGGVDFRDTISLRVDAGEAPDIADFSQFDLLPQFVSQGMVVDPTTFISPAWLQQQYQQSWLDMSRIEGQTAGVWHRFRGNSLVWYPKADFEAQGYTVPSTWAELQALMDQIVAGGDTPWCIGIESGQATGWPAADWLADFVLRTTSLESYDRWVTGDLPFSSPEIKHAAEVMAEIWFEDTYVYSGTARIPYTFFGDSPAPMFADPPQCWLHRQGPLIVGYFPAEAEFGVDYGFFLLPEIDPAFGRPMLVTGDLMVMFNDRPEVRALMEYFTTPNSVTGWLEAGGALAAQQTATPEMYGSELEAEMARWALQATSFRYDASVSMPPEVDESFWKGMTRWISGRADLDTVLAEIDASWPR